jgi:hypothetical protein
MRWAGNIAHVGVKKLLKTILFFKPEGKKSLGSLRSRWKDNITIIFKKI